uniref:Proteasomal ATPase associated factor 1 n=1 Tax=Cercocebus atys TaxID=9531 RepID=A0A2K5NED8_CERAT
MLALKPSSVDSKFSTTMQAYVFLRCFCTAWVLTSFFPSYSDVDTVLITSNMIANFCCEPAGWVQTKSIHISCPKESASSKFLAPYTTFSRIHTKSRVLEGHVFDVNCCRFFPSGLVVLSGGMDAQLKIWSAEDASCVVTFKGHKGGILDTAIVDRGRNVVSGSRDGTARLWDCGRSACLGVLADCGSSINGVAVGAADNSINLGSPEQMPSEREVGTEAKMLLLAREDKKLQCLGLQSRQPVFLFIGSDAFNCCTFLSGFLLLAGTQDGNIYQLDVRSPGAPVQVIHRSGAPVLSLLSFRDGFIASQGDGSCFIVQQDLDYVTELTGADCDPVYKVATWEKQIYTCCRDGLVRRYQLSDL